MSSPTRGFAIGAAGLMCLFAFVAIAPTGAAEIKRYNYTTCYVADTLLCTQYYCWYDTETDDGTNCKAVKQCMVRSNSGTHCGRIDAVE